MKKYTFIFVLLLCACTPKNEPQATPRVAPQESTVSTAQFSEAQKVLDPSTLASEVAAIDPSRFDYPFAIDSVVVDNYAKAYNITPAQAQHSMVLAMGAPEALTKVIDQIQGHYMGHSLTDGKDMALIIYTDDKVAPMQFDYVLSDFGRGLVLPVHVTQTPNVPPPN